MGSLCCENNLDDAIIADFRKKKEDLEKNLDEKKETTELRISSLQKLEAKTREKAETLQKDVMASMKK